MALNLLSKAKETFEELSFTASTKLSEAGEKPLTIETVKTRAKDPTDAIFGLSPKGDVIHMPISAMPHMLVAGTTGSGKSVLLNELLLTMIVHATPDELKIAIVDPKKVEFTRYKNQPHMLANPVTDLDDAYALIRYMVIEMKRRYALMAEENVRNIESYNKKMAKKGQKPLPYIILLCDEFSQLMMEHREIEDEIVQLGQMARAAGIHLIIATQSPRTTVITGIIKANIPSRVSLMVASELESRIVLDESGAEGLRPRGDMLIKTGGSNNPIRAQGAFISDEEIDAVTKFLSDKYGEPELVDFKEIVAREDGEEQEIKTSKDDFGGLKRPTAKRNVKTAVSNMDMNSDKPSIEKVSPFAMKLDNKREEAREKGEELPDLPRLQAEKLAKVIKTIEGGNQTVQEKELPKLKRTTKMEQSPKAKAKKDNVTSSPIMQMMMKKGK